MSTRYVIHRQQNISRKLTALIALPTLLFGGAEMVAVCHARYFQQMGWRVLVWVWSNTTGSLEPEIRRLGAAVHFYQQETDSALFRETLDEVDIVYLAAPMQFTVELCQMARRDRWWRGKIIMVAHNDRDSTLQPLRDYGKHLDLVIAITPQIQRTLEREFSRMPLALLVNAVDTHKYTPDYLARRAVRNELNIAGDELILGYTGRVDDIKNLDSLPEVARRVSDWLDMPVSVMVIGDNSGPWGWTARERFMAMAHRVLGERFYFIGYTPHVDYYLQAIDIFMLISWGEGLSVALLEALACGKPAVVTEAGGGSPFAVGDAGITVKLQSAYAQGKIVNDADLNALAEAVGTVYLDYDEYAARARARGVAFSERDNVAQFRGIIEEL